MNKRLSLAALAATLALTGWGCQNPLDAAKDKITDKIGETVAEKAIEKATGGKVDLSKKAATFKDEKTGDYYSYGEDLELPSDFPVELKKVDGAKVSHFSGKGDKSSYNAIEMVQSTDAAKVAEDLDASVKGNGYTRTSDASYGGSIIRTYEKGKNTMSVMVVADAGSDDSEAKPQTIITLTLNVKSDE